MKQLAGELRVSHMDRKHWIGNERERDQVIGRSFAFQTQMLERSQTRNRHWIYDSCTRCKQSRFPADEPQETVINPLTDRRVAVSNAVWPSSCFWFSVFRRPDLHNEAFVPMQTPTAVRLSRSHLVTLTPDPHRLLDPERLWRKSRVSLSLCPGLMLSLNDGFDLSRLSIRLMFLRKIFFCLIICFFYQHHQVFVQNSQYIYIVVLPETNKGLWDF